MPTGSLPTCTTLEHVSTFLKQSKISLSSVTRYLKESLFVGRKGRKNSRTDDCLVGNSSQDRKTSVGEGERRRKPHNQELYIVVFGQGRLLLEQLYVLKFTAFLVFENIIHNLKTTLQ